MTAGECVNLILKRLGGGQLRKADQGWMLTSVIAMICVYRDGWMQQKATKLGDKDPSPAFFTQYRGAKALPVHWDEDLGMAAVALPMGNPIYMSRNRGVTVWPVSRYVQAPQGWAETMPALWFCEGKTVWQQYDGKIVFPKMPRSQMPAKVDVSVIETGTVSPDAPLPMPSDYTMYVMEEVYVAMGGTRKDTKADFVGEENKR